MPGLRRDKNTPYNHGLVPPGYDNMGPWNEVTIGPAGRNIADVQSRDHDIEYGIEEANGVNPKTNWVDADEEYLRDLNPTNWKEKGAQVVFSVKKAAKNAGLIRDMSGKRKRIESKKVTRKEKPKAKRIVKPIRETPFTEGEAFRERREERTRRHEENMRTRDVAWETDVGANRVEEQEIEEQEVEATGEAMAVDEENWWESENTEGENFESFDNLQASEQMRDEMDVVGDEPMEEASMARSSGPGGNGAPSKETQISMYPSLTYGLQETHTTILPWTGWFSCATLTTAGPGKMEIRMNSPYDMIVSTVNALTAGGAPAAALNQLYDRPFKADGLGAPVSFPEVITGATAVERPYWRNYWSQLYEYYTVLGCEWKLTVINPSSVPGASSIIGWNYDAYTDAAGSAGNVTPSTNLSEAMSLKGMQFKVIQEKVPSNNGRHDAVITGRYKPGQAKRNVANDGDVKTWVKTDFDNTAATPTNLPSLKEHLNLFFWRAPLAHDPTGGVNCQIELKYIVQFKDLRSMARYPVSTGSSAAVVQTISTNRNDIGNPLAKWV